MPPVKPLSQLPTQEITNIPPHLSNQELWQDNIAFSASRLGDRWAGSYGTLPVNVDFNAIIDRASPAA